MRINAEFLSWLVGISYINPQSLMENLMDKLCIAVSSQDSLEISFFTLSVFDSVANRRKTFKVLFRATNGSGFSRPVLYHRILFRRTIYQSADQTCRCFCRYISEDIIWRYIGTFSDTLLNAEWNCICR